MRHHQKEREKGYKRNIVINAVGSVATFIVLLIVATTKFTSGAWVPLVVIPVIVFGFKTIHRHYKTVADGLRVTPDYKPRRMNHTVVVLVGGVHRGVLEGLAYARSLSPNHLVAVSVVSDEEEQEKLERHWQEYGIDVPLEIVYSPYRELTRPILRYVDELDARWENDVITVLLAGVRRAALVGQHPPQPDRAAAQGPTAVPQGHGGDVAPVPPGVTNGPRPETLPKDWTRPSPAPLLFPSFSAPVVDHAPALQLHSDTHPEVCIP